MLYVSDGVREPREHQATRSIDRLIARYCCCYYRCLRVSIARSLSINTHPHIHTHPRELDTTLAAAINRLGTFVVASWNCVCVSHVATGECVRDGCASRAHRSCRAPRSMATSRSSSSDPAFECCLNEHLVGIGRLEGPSGSRRHKEQQRPRRRRSLSREHQAAVAFAVEGTSSSIGRQGRRRGSETDPQAQTATAGRVDVDHRAGGRHHRPPERRQVDAVQPADARWHSHARHQSTTRHQGRAVARDPDSRHDARPCLRHDVLSSQDLHDPRSRTRQAGRQAGICIRLWRLLIAIDVLAADV